ncbi:unnamed protein product [Camellia sinensis]
MLQASLPFVVCPIFSAIDPIGLGCIPSPTDVSEEEGIDFMWNKGRGSWPIRIGCLNPKSQLPRLSMMTMRSLNNEDFYFICPEILCSGMAKTWQVSQEFKQSIGYQLLRCSSVFDANIHTPVSQLYGEILEENGIDLAEMKVLRRKMEEIAISCKEAAMQSLLLARQHASSEHERLVYEGWILYDMGHCEEGLRKAEDSISLMRSFEAFFLKAYALADSSHDSSCSSTVISLLQDALKCPSDQLRKGLALNNLGSVYVDCGKLDLAADCYIDALKIRHTRAHQGLARVHFLRNNKTAAYEEMTKLIEKARNNVSAYEKRSEYSERELTKADLEMVTHLDPLRVYPYRYRAAVLMDNHKEKEAIAKLSRGIAFKADLNLLHLRAAFHEHIGDVMGALRDYRVAVSIDPSHEMLELHSTDFKSVGIQFKPSKTYQLTDIDFNPTCTLGILKLPRMIIDDATKSILLNSAAYEACPDSVTNFGVTSYICFMDSRIDHAEDVKVLRSKGILLNFLGSDQQVADIFNEIATELVPSPHAYVQVKTRIEKHQRNSMKIWMAEWHHTYFRSPRTFIAVAAASLAITLSVFQTILAAIQTNLTAHPPKG